MIYRTVAQWGCSVAPNLGLGAIGQTTKEYEAARHPNSDGQSKGFLTSGSVVRVHPVLPYSQPAAASGARMDRAAAGLAQETKP